MKRFLMVVLAVLFTLTVFAGCSDGAAPNDAEAAVPTDVEAEPSEADNDADEPAEMLRIALVTDKVGNQPFLQNMVQAINDSADENGFEAIVVECDDNAAFEDNMRALLYEGVDLLIGGGWKAGEAINTLAVEFPEAASYCLLDSEVEAENVKCISFREQEGCYLLGMMAAMIAEDGQNLFGDIGVFEGPADWKWSWGFIEGVKSINPDAEFIINYVGSYDDPAKAKELALQQYAQGAHFIMSACAGGDYGTFEAALEKGFFTSSTDIDQTTPDNPYIATSVIKDTYISMRYIIDLFLSGEQWDGENEVLGVADGAIGLVHVTHEGKGPIPEGLSEEELEQLHQAVKDIASGDIGIDFANVPIEEEYDK